VQYVLTLEVFLFIGDFFWKTRSIKREDIVYCVIYLNPKDAITAVLVIDAC
jgi:hypothetical protein